MENKAFDGTNDIHMQPIYSAQSLQRLNSTQNPTQNDKIYTIPVDNYNAKTSPAFINAIRKTKEKFLNKKDDQLQDRRRRSYDYHSNHDNPKQESLAVVFDQLKANYITKRREYDFEEQIRQDKVYYPSEMASFNHFFLNLFFNNLFYFLKDFDIAARLIKDAIEGRDVEFKTNKLGLKYIYIYIYTAV
jgi:hypothetical protein